MLVLIASGYLELQGLRILSPELSLTQAWSTTYVLGALRTAVGAASLGAFAVGSGLLLRPIRRWTRRRWPFVWGAGAALFLIALAGLVRWAP